MNPHSSFLLLLYIPILFLSPSPITGTSLAAEEIGVLSSNSRWIVDQSGRRVKLACANWAAHLESVVVEGLDKQPVDDIAGAVRSMGFNCVRLTWPVYLATKPSISSLTVDESLRHLGLIDSAEGIAVNNPDILNLTLIEAFKEVVSFLGHHNIMVILDNQISTPGWCCSKFDGNGFFGDKYFDPDEWIESLKIMAATFNSSSNVVGMSLRNELRGPRQNIRDWYRYMQMGAEAVHAMNPTVLIILSGLDNDKTLTFLYDKQVELTFKEKLVFEMHWYGFSDGGDWESGNLNAVCGNISKSMFVKGGFLLEQGWPLFLSEFGVDTRGNNIGDNHFLSCFLSVAAELDLDWAIWALQGSYYIREGQPNFDETYGVLSWDWSKPRNPNFIQRISVIQSPFQGTSFFFLSSAFCFALFCCLEIDDKIYFDSGPGLSSSSPYNVIFHPLTGLCVVQNKLNGKPGLGSCVEYEAWNYTSGHNLVLKDSGLCLNAEAEDNEVKFGTNCESSSSKWELITDSQMLLSTKTVNNGSIVCLDIDHDYTIITSSCKCLVEEGPCSAESQWFKIVYRSSEGSSPFKKLRSV